MKRRLHDAGLVTICLALTAMAPGARAGRASEARDGGAPGADGRIAIQLSWGHRSAAGTPFQVRPRMVDGVVEDLAARDLEGGDELSNGGFETRAGGGDVDGAAFVVRCANRTIAPIANPHEIWKYLLANTDVDTAARLRLDPGYRPDARKLSVLMDAKGSRGFSLTVDQLLNHRTFWIPELDVFVAVGPNPESFEAHQKRLAPRHGERILDRTEREPEATYEEFTRRWEDMGSDRYRNPAARPPGHVVCVGWDSSLHKFGIDHRAGVHSDLGNPDRFQLTFEAGEPASQPARPWTWRGQRLTDGLPVLVTELESDDARCEIEQFATPLDGPPATRDGEIDMVLLQRVRIAERKFRSQSFTFRLKHQLGLSSSREPTVRPVGGSWVAEDPASGAVRLAVSGPVVSLRSLPVAGAKAKQQVIEITLAMADGACEFLLRLPSPMLPRERIGRLLEVDHHAARAAMLRYWSDLLDRGARFSVPEPAVNQLFRANLWHALRLPRRHGERSGQPTIDLPYSNFAYDQKGTPWPVNQAVYVDDMLYDLRGYHEIAAEELGEIFRNNQEPGGHVGGFANWGVYTPSMMVAVSQHYLLTGDRAALDRLLPQALKALDWCLAQVRRTGPDSDRGFGLVLAPLNDLTKEDRAWAFNQAYLFAGLDQLGRVLTEIGHPRAEECRSAARAFREVVQARFAQAATEAPLVQLRDHTWMPYVPCDAGTPRRLMDVWYPTDVDTGALHLSRLGAFEPNGPLTTYLLHDHEDNLFLNGWGMANEPVYNQQATAYLLRDQVKPAIRAFYSMMACAFSHSVFEPVEHRWGWGQYFGPPSTDGAWFELYRRMLIHERDDDTLLLLQATPRRWLEDGKTIEIARAPTYFGPLALSVTSRARSGRIVGRLDVPARRRPRALLIRLRHPEAAAMKSVTVNGRAWTDFDPAREWVRIEKPAPGSYDITASY